MDEFSYENLVSKFFVENELLPTKCKRVENCFTFVSQKLSFAFSSTTNIVKKRITSLELTFMKKWRDSQFDAKKFRENNEEWLHRSLQLPLSATKTALSTKTRGRPKANVNHLSQSTKNRRAVDLSAYDTQILLLALVKAATSKNYTDLSFVAKFLHKHIEDGASKIRRFLQDTPKSQKLHPLKGLAYLLDNRLSKAQYINTRLLTKEKGSDIFPAYNKILQTKLECRPPPENMIINDVCASLSLQSLLDHTASRLLLLQEDVLTALISNTHDNELAVKLQLKWGFDGSSNQSAYNQKYVNVQLTQNCKSARDASLFATTVVPLRISVTDGSDTLIWNNTSPQSPRWCRPLRLQFEKETPKLTLLEKQSVEAEIDGLQTLNVSIAGINISVSYELHLTMIDGKVLTVITNTKSNQTCCICKATPKQFNDLKNISERFKPQENTLNYGISVLHLWIRSFEWLLHISYRLTTKQWQMRGNLKTVLKDRKLILQDRFIKEMQIRVDFPNNNGSGNSNSGPVARAAFSKPDTLSKILGLDVNLIRRISTILIALSCQLPLDVDKFHDFCLETATFYVKNYNWFPMPPSVHKMLIHSRALMLANNLPLGVLAEDAAESCNKFYRHNRQFHARKTSRRDNLLDVFNRALDSSDPLIASYGQQKRLNSRRRKCIPVEVQKLLKMPDVSMCEVAEEVEELEEDLDDVLSEIYDTLDGVNLPEDTYYEECC